MKIESIVQISLERTLHSDVCKKKETIFALEDAVSSWKNDKGSGTTIPSFFRGSGFLELRHAIDHEVRRVKYEEMQN